MRKVKDAVDLSTKEKIYFKGHAKATYLSDGRSVEEAINSGVGGGYDDTEIRQELTNVNATALEAHELATLANERIDAIEIEVPEVDLSEINQSLDKIESELTELSEEVSGLSERVDDLEQGGQGSSDIFKAEYGVTTYEEVLEAYNQGKIIHCDYENRCYELAVFTANIAWFSCLNTTTSFLLTLNAESSWSKASYGLENIGNRVDTIQADAKPYQYPSVKAVYDATQKMMPATPSGDPMHYMFEAVGAEWNGTGADIERQGVYGDTITHKAGYWYLNELGDITNEEMRVIYNERYPIPSAKYIPEWFREAKARTTLSALSQSVSTNLSNMCRAAQCETFAILGDNAEIQISQLNEAFYDCAKLRKILNVFHFYSVTSISAPFGRCYELEHLRIRKLRISMDFKYNEKISKFSILYMIDNEVATSAITIRLSSALYDSYMADADIQAALAAHPNVSLAK